MAEETWEKQAPSNYWNPQEPGDEIKGKVSKIEEGTFGKHYTIQQTDGSEITTPAHKVLLSRMRNVVKGDMVRVTFDGTDLPKVKGQNPTRMYSVYVRRA